MTTEENMFKPTTGVRSAVKTINELQAGVAKTTLLLMRDTFTSMGVNITSSQQAIDK